MSARPSPSSGTRCASMRASTERVGAAEQVERGAGVGLDRAARLGEHIARRRRVEPDLRRVGRRVGRVDEPDAGAGRVVAVARARASAPRRPTRVGLARVWARRAQIGERDGAGAQHDRHVARHVDDGRLEPDTRRLAHQDGVDAAAEVVADGLPRRRARAAGAVCARRNERRAGGADERAGGFVVRESARRQWRPAVTAAGKSARSGRTSVSGPGANAARSAGRRP